MLEGCLIDERLPAIVAKTYESIAREVLAMMAPIQSISVFIRCHLFFQVGGPSSSLMPALSMDEGRPQSATATTIVLRIAAR